MPIHNCRDELLTPALPSFIYELILNSFQSYFRNNRLKEDTPNSQQEQITIGWVLCSTHFEDIVMITLEKFNDIVT